MQPEPAAEAQPSLAEYARRLREIRGVNLQIVSIDEYWDPEDLAFMAAVEEALRPPCDTPL